MQHGFAIGTNAADWHDAIPEIGSLDTTHEQLIV